MEPLLSSFFTTLFLFCLSPILHLTAHLLWLSNSKAANSLDKKTCQLAADFQLLFSTRFSGFGSLHLFQFFMVGWKI
jgi:hypothetical protein